MMNMKTNTDIQLSKATRCGYGVAYIADTIIVDFVSAFFLFFLTNIVGINPVLAGSVASISIFWDAITGPVIGNMADRFGKYRRFLMISILPIVICMILMFLKVNFGGMAVFVYYLIISMLYYMSYSLYNIPYLALGNCLTTNEIEKTKLSSVRQSFGFVGALFSGALPAILIDGFQGIGVSADKSYTFTAVILAVCAAAAIFITWFATKGKELDFSQETSEKGEEKEEGALKMLGLLLKHKPYLILLTMTFIFFVGYTFLTGSIMYVISGVLGLSESASSGIFIILALSGVVICMVLGKLAELFEKKIVYMVSVGISVVGMLIVKVIGLSALWQYGVYIFIINIGFSGFLMLIFNFLYDIVDIIGFKSGKRVSGAVIAYYSFIYKLGKAGGMQVIGILLAKGGYDAALAEQTADGVEAIMNITTLYPAIIYILSLVLFIFYPVTRKRMQALQEANAKKQAGEKYTTEGFEKIL